MKTDSDILDRLLAAGQGIITPEEEERLRYLVARGSTLNNPKIGRAYVEAHGILLTSDDPPSELRAVVRAHPLQ